MALTLQLEKENVGIDHIKTVPDKKVFFYVSSSLFIWIDITEQTV